MGLEDSGESSCVVRWGRDREQWQFFQGGWGSRLLTPHSCLPMCPWSAASPASPPPPCLAWVSCPSMIRVSGAPPLGSSQTAPPLFPPVVRMVIAGIVHSLCARLRTEAVTLNLPESLLSSCRCTGVGHLPDRSVRLSPQFPPPLGGSPVARRDQVARIYPASLSPQQWGWWDLLEAGPVQLGLRPGSRKDNLVP